MANQGRSVLITGSARGIGAGIALEFARAGYSYIGINYSTDQENAEKVAEQVREIGAEAIVIQADVCQAAECKAMVAKFVEFAGKIDVLINNAGGGGTHPEGTFTEIPLEHWDRMIALNLNAAMYCCRYALRDMKEKGTKGRIVNISSQNAYRSWVQRKLIPYSSAKGGLNTFTLTLANEVAPLGIVVNGIAPGLVMTSITEKRYDEAKKAEWQKHIPVGFLGQPEDIAHLAVFLADEVKSRYIVGQTILVDGGQLGDGIL